MEAKRTCDCGHPLPPHQRRYCSTCAPRASALWNRAARRANRGTKYWLDHWLKVAGNEQGARAAYNGYMRRYMQEYRRKRRQGVCGDAAPTKTVQKSAIDRHSRGTAALTVISAIFALVMTAEGAAQPVPSAEPPHALRVYLVVDNSWSTAKLVGKATRIEGEIQASQRWATAIDVPSDLTVELLTASDRVDIVGTFALRSEADRANLSEAIRRIQPIRATRTIFSAVDGDLAGVVRRDTGPGEEFGLIFLSDMVSDDPDSDLRAEEIGDRVVNVGGGVSAIVLGNVPATDALAGRGAPLPRVAPRRTASLGRSSVVRKLQNSVIRIDAEPAVAGLIVPLFLGGATPVRSEIRVTNDIGVTRLIQLDSVMPAGVAAKFFPNPMIVPAGETATAKLELSALKPVQGKIVVIARLPDGRSQQHTMQIDLVRRLWLVQHAWAVSAAVAGLLVALSTLFWRGRRALRVGDHAETEKQASLAVGDAVPLATFAPGVTGVLRRGLLGFAVVAEEQPLSVGGRLISARKHARYALGEEIRCGDRSFAIYNLDSVPRVPNNTDFALDAGWGNGGGIR